MLFLAAGVSDAVDGYLAKRFDMTTELGAYLDPLADKALIVSIYLTLGIKGLIPGWLVILVVSRDIMIVGAVMLSWLVGIPLKVKPLLVSKLNTVAQIVFACVVLGTVGFGYALPTLTLGAHGAGRRVDLVVCRRLCGRVGSPHEFYGCETVSRRPASRPHRGAAMESGVFQRQLIFWLAALGIIRAGAVAAQRHSAAVCCGPCDRVFAHTSHRSS